MYIYTHTNKIPEGGRREKLYYSEGTLLGQVMGPRVARNRESLKGAAPNVSATACWDSIPLGAGRRKPNFFNGGTGPNWFLKGLLGEEDREDLHGPGTRLELWLMPREAPKSSATLEQSPLDPFIHYLQGHIWKVAKRQHQPVWEHQAIDSHSSAQESSAVTKKLMGLSFLTHLHPAEPFDAYRTLMLEEFGWLLVN